MELVLDYITGARTRVETVRRPAYAVPEGVEGVQWDGATTSLLYVLNHRPTSVDIDLDEPVKDLLAGHRLTGTCTMDPYGVAIFGHERRLS